MNNLEESENKKQIKKSVCILSLNNLLLLLLIGLIGYLIWCIYLDCKKEGSQELGQGVSELLSNGLAKIQSTDIQQSIPIQQITGGNFKINRILSGNYDW
jgi:hypothetical protein